MCPDEGQEINVYGADYGRRDSMTCAYKRPQSQIQNTDCYSPAPKVAQSCNGKNSCVIRASNSEFGDSCGGTYKYLEVAYVCQFALMLLRTRPLTCCVTVSTERALTCDDVGNVQRLSCGSGVVVVTEALYGRAESLSCSEGRPHGQVIQTQCSQAGAKKLVKTRCDGKSECELNMDLFRTSDPCYGTYKYLDTNYTCFPAHQTVACEQSLAFLRCDEGQEINVYGADYGRRDSMTCAYKRPQSQIQNTDCYSPAPKVAQSCNGKNSCVIRASNSEFGDSCGGTYKYLEVAYVCQYPFNFIQIALMLLRTISTERALTCDDVGNVQRLSCGSGVVVVTEALYGRAESLSCSEGRPHGQVIQTQCSQAGAKKLVKTRCDGKSECELNMDLFRTSDPCYGTYKYLDTNYTCFPAHQTVACEQSLAFLRCDEGQEINVYGADYGRRDSMTCAYKRPQSQIQNTDCYSPAPKVAQSCNGKNSCVIRASNSEFGDSCGGTYKYLEVAYVCQYPFNFIQN
ncbi:rhamnose-binding lectin-like [Eucyclogobius newberryi]|uniref:rhamnose-binding lectin-like n=1 Tax=Eucyclogobius newberryi TaxID=166745 RepID=UPI003B5C869A